MRTFFRIVLKPLSFLPAIFMMYIIFSFSAQDAETSSQISYKVSHKVIEIGAEVIDADFEAWEIENLASRFHGSIRKIAHMTEYFALAVSVAFPLYVYGLRGFFLVIVAGLFCIAFACGDEYHQSLVAGRNPSKRDVAIDSIGIFAGIILTRIVGWTGRKTIFRPLAKRKKRSLDNTHADFTEYSTDYSPNGSHPNPHMQQNYSPDEDFYDEDNPDSLSEDMSLKRLLHELKDQKKSVHVEKRAARKPHLEGSEIPEAFVELTEIDLDDK